MEETANSSLLCGLNKHELELLLSNAKKKTYGKDRPILKHGERSSYAYIINSGRVKVFLSDEHGKEIVLAFLEPGEYFGEMSLIDSDECSASVSTVEETVLALISRENFRECMRANPEIAEREEFASAARAAGVEYPELLQRIINLGLRQQRVE